MPAKAPAKWVEIKKEVSSLNQAELIELVKNLFDQSHENKLFLASRFSSQPPGEDAIAPYRKRIVDQFFPARGYGKAALGEARKAIREYKKATSDLLGTAELMMVYVEQGTEYTNSYGDITEAFYISMESVLEELTKLLSSPQGRGLYLAFKGRLRKLEHDAGDIGWGYGDEVSRMVEELEESMRTDGEATPDDEE
ncbi:hypothetical protein LBMAG21_01160 [Armatimonadota bacterium]|nr:hypothetical protein LBMAG21_01160 [Armatimonadota bacterium]